jgi:hypothetical protein
MADYERSTIVDAPSDETFAWLVDPAHLPIFLQMLKRAERIPGGLRVMAETARGPLERDVNVQQDTAARRFDWHPRGSRYHGQIAVAEEGAGSRVTIWLHTTERARPDQVEQALRYALARIRETVPGVPATKPSRS